jgi:signal transduction histidine kinase
MAAMGTLSAGLGHDMGNMVAAMRLRLDMLQKTADARTEHLEAVGDCVTYLHNLATGLRLMTLDPEDKKLGPEPVSLAAWWRAAHRVLASGVTHGIVVVSHVSEELPQVLINRVGLTQAAYNLVQNAADAMVGRRGCITIAAELDETRANVLLSFADDGHGMTEKVRQRCMDPLFSTKASSTSSGLGLALVHTVVKAANASISVESQAGQGTKFTLTLPVVK